MEMHILMYDYQKKKKKKMERERNGGVWDLTSSYIILSSLSTGIIGRTIDCILCTDLKGGWRGAVMTVMSAVPKQHQETADCQS